MIDRSFFRTKHFAIAGAIALLILGAAAGAYAVGGRAIAGSELACAAPAVAGRDLALAPSVTNESGGERRVVRYAFDAGALAAGALDLCVSVGEIRVEPATGTQVELEFTITARHARAVESTVVAAKAADDGGRLRVGAWEAERGEALTGLFDSRSADVRLVVRVPDAGAWDVRAVTDVGDARVSGVRASALDMGTDVGAIVVSDVGLEGGASLRTDVGDIIFALASVQTGNISAHTDVGEIDIQLPRRADVGYDAVARTDVGNIEMRLGDVEVDRVEESGPSGERAQRTAGFGTKPTRVGVLAQTDVGDIRVVSMEP